MEGGGRDSGMFSPVWEFISSLLRAFLLRMSGAGDSCDWLLVALLAKNPQASDTPTSKIFLTLLCGRAVRRFYPKRLTYSILWTIPTGATWGEVSQGHNDMLTAVGFEPVLPLSEHQGSNPLRHSLRSLTC